MKRIFVAVLQVLLVFGLAQPAFALSSHKVIQLAVGRDFSCALMEDQTVDCWGQNQSGELGTGDLTPRLEPLPVLGLSNIVQITTGDIHACAITSEGQAYCWGYNYSGQVGNGLGGVANKNVLQPVLVSTKKKVVQISAGGMHTCAVLEDSSVTCWGLNQSGELGNGTHVSSPYPVDVSLTGVSKVYVSDNDSCAVMLDTTVRCWGYNGEGQIGNGTTSDSSTPQEVTGLSGVSSLGVGAYRVCAVMIDGTVMCWGHYSTSSDWASFNQLTPEKAQYYLGVKSVSVSNNFLCALVDQGQAECEGSIPVFQNGGFITSGEIGYGVPTIIATSSVLTQVGTSQGLSACALTNDGQVLCWGYGYNFLDFSGVNPPYLPTFVAGFDSGNLSKTSTPQILGTIAVGSPLTVDVGQWDPGVHFTYSWMLDGSPIIGGSSLTYTPSPTEATHLLSVSVSGSLPGFSTVTKKSSALTVLGKLTQTPSPTVSGIFKVGSTLSAVTGVWDEGVQFTFQWLRDGSEVPNASQATYLVSPSDVSHVISVRVTGTLPMYLPQSKTSSGEAVVAGDLARIPAITVLGISRVGEMETAVTGDWDQEVIVSCQWFSNNSPIVGASRCSYVLTPDLAGKNLSVTVTGSLAGFNPVVLSSNSVKVSLGLITSMPLKVIGVAKPGRVLNSKVSAWIAGARIGYQWLLDGKPIRGATSKTLKVVSAYSGHQVSLKVTESKLGYSPASKVSGGLRVG